jgi:hypothetical protein
MICQQLRYYYWLSVFWFASYGYLRVFLITGRFLASDKHPTVFFLNCRSLFADIFFEIKEYPWSLFLKWGKSKDFCKFWWVFAHNFLSLNNWGNRDVEFIFW